MNSLLERDFFGTAVLRVQSADSAPRLCLGVVRFTTESARMPKRRVRIKKGVLVGRVLKQRDYAAEYARRIARWLAKGLSRSQARGHPKPGEGALIVRKRRVPLDDERLQRALRVLRQDRNLSAAAKAARISPERLRQVAASKGAITKQKRRWVVNPALPRRMPIYSQGRQIAVTVGGLSSASLIGRYMSAVGNLFKSNDRKWLQPFIGQSVADISGKAYPFETNPNALYRLASTGGDSFEQVYRIVV